MNRLVVFFIALGFAALGSCSHPIDLSEEDKIELVRRTLETAAVQKQIPDFGLLKDTTAIILSDRNIRRSWVPTFNDVVFVVSAPDSIQARANRAGDFLYFEFAPMEPQDDGSVLVFLSIRWAKSNLSKVVYLSGGGLGLFFKKSWGTWKELGKRLKVIS